MKKLLCLVFLVWGAYGFGSAVLYADVPSLGEIIIQKDKQKKMNYPIRQAFIYRRVVLAYDTTAFIQSDSSSMVLYSPQFSRGENNVLRIIAGNLVSQPPDFYDIMIILGDSLRDTISWKGDSSLIFLSPNGLLQSGKAFSKNMNGQVIFTSTRKKEIQSGVLQLEYDLLDPAGQTIESHFILSGQFEILVGDFREISLGKTDSDLREKERKRQNIYWAVIISVFLIAIFGLR